MDAGARDGGRQRRWARALGLLGAVTAGAALLVASPPGAGPAGAAPRAGNLGVSPVNSLDWSGYAVTGPTFSDVAGSWTQPAAVCGGLKAQQAAFWVGLDGLAATDPTVEQVGTDSDCAKGTKKAPGGGVYYAWYELFPAGVVVLPPGTYPVHPGDALSAGVTVSGASYTMSIADAGHWAYSTTVTTPKAEKNSSAEWIAEAPPVCTGKKCKPQPLADFGSVTFTKLSADGEAPTAANLVATPVTMTNKGGSVIMASPGPLVGGTAFTVAWLAL